MESINHTVVFKGVTCKVSKAHYQGGQVALVLNDANSGERFAVASSCINAPLEPNETAIKTYSENEGIFEVLLDAKIIEDTGIGFHNGCVDFPIVKVLI